MKYDSLEEEHEWQTIMQCIPMPYHPTDLHPVLLNHHQNLNLMVFRSIKSPPFHQYQLDFVKL